MMIFYLIKMTLCALLLITIYFLFLEKEKMHRYKRFYLIGSLFLSLLIPFISLEFTSIPFPVWDQYIPAIEMEINEETLSGAEVNVSTHVFEEKKSSVTIKESIFYVYIFIAIVLFLRYFYNIIQLLLLVSKNEVIRYKHAKLVLMNNKHLTFSFWKYIFIQKDQFYNKETKPEILSHELAHVYQKHTLDILLIELLTIVFWFNPVIYIYKRCIQLNHEFLADEQVIMQTNATDYQLMLLNEIKKNNNLKLASYFNYLVTKKRFIMMTKRTSLKTTLCKGSIGLLAMLLVFGFFSVKIEAQEVKVEETVTHSEDVYIVPGSGVTPEEINTYKATIDKYLEGVDGNHIIWKSKDVSEEDWKALYPIFLRMTKEQQQQIGEIFIYFIGPLNYMRTGCPNKDEWNAAKSNKNKRIWLDGKEVTAEELNSYDRHNIACFIRDYENKEYSYLWTKKGIEDYRNKYKTGILLSELLQIKPQIWFTRSLKS
ncbi:M56 family metallopeptidase [Bacteroides sp. 519]|uniref:M56 family metallopeptidase n=1 Tax=Bacteroides sp. 519 TaxID=2302937 RepID=UPI0013CFB4CC|nr:M56 family metallopeptidase [Bacteroides sp. 519]NDV59424.1 hypothetical protein [Bacteroides sp. 519]